MTKSYLTLKRLFLTLANIYLEKGDILVYDAAAKANNLTVYRGGDLVKTVTHSPVGISALVRAGTLQELNTTSAPPTPKPAVVPLPPKPLKPAKPVKASVPAIIREAPGLPSGLGEYRANVEVWALPSGS